MSVSARIGLLRRSGRPLVPAGRSFASAPATSARRRLGTGTLTLVAVAALRAGLPVSRAPQMLVEDPVVERWR